MIVEIGEHDLQGRVAGDGARFRRAIYQGCIFKITPLPETAGVVRAVERIVVEHFGSGYRAAQFEMPEELFFQNLADAKQAVHSDDKVRRLVSDLLEVLGFSLDENAFDPPRLRVVTHGGHESARARVAYSAHRDTWYANSQSQINWWMPLHDTEASETFCFYPGSFATPVRNSSSEFDYRPWVSAVGFGRSQMSSSGFYPVPAGQVPGDDDAIRFSCRSGEVIVFSAAHLHRTLENTSGASRCSIDFRTVNLVDESEGKGAPNVDNESSGRALEDYIHPGRCTGATDAS